MTINRRDFLQALAAAGAIASTAALAAPPPAQAGTAPTNPKPDHDMSGMPASWMGSERIAMLLYPGFTALDLIGPQHFLGGLMGATVDLVAQTREPVISDNGLAILPTATFDDCPRDLDLLFSPGGAGGTLDAMENAALIAFVADRGARAKRVCSVCTGSLVLAKAGLLRGYRATSHWVARDLLADFGATPVDARVVVDRNRITGAGVSAGLDLGLALVAAMRDVTYAQTAQLTAEYAPQPPLSAGTPATAPKAVTDSVLAMFTGFTARSKLIAAATP